MVGRYRANQLNTAKSTGPRTEEGKRKSSRNALKHGLTSKEILIGDERAEDFGALLKGLEADFAPSSTIEHELVRRLATLFWRQRRVHRLEVELMRSLREESECAARPEELKRKRIEGELLERVGHFWAAMGILFHSISS